MDLKAFFSQLFFFWCSTLALCALFHVVERLSPAERGHTWQAALTNFRIVFVYSVLSPLGRIVGLLAVGYVTAKAARLSGAPWLKIPSSGPLVVLTAIFPLLTYDFFYYWMHRLQHANRWLWQQHKLHHSDHSLNVTTAFRLNWTEDFLKALFIALPTATLFDVSPVTIGLLTSATGGFAGFWGVFIHANIGLPFGPLTAVITGPQFHRIHHSTQPQHSDRNFSTYLPLWDILFGTYYRPAPDEFPKTGVIGEATDPTFREIIAEPALSWLSWLR
jgi:sterol desaturase/sphingolipid hydroxylase (fatty acid hydroxylase superfamily)